MGQPLRFATAGTYAIVVQAWGSPAAGGFKEMALLVDGKVVRTATGGRRSPEDHRFDVEFAAGIHTIAVAFLNDAVVDQEDRNLYLDRFTITPPPGVAAPDLADKRELAQAAERRVAGAQQQGLASRFPGNFYSWLCCPRRTSIFSHDSTLVVNSH